MKVFAQVLGALIVFAILSAGVSWAAKAAKKGSDKYSHYASVYREIDRELIRISTQCDRSSGGQEMDLETYLKCKDDKAIASTLNPVSMATTLPGMQGKGNWEAAVAWSHTIKQFRDDNSKWNDLHRFLSKFY
ncbi:hypothetical protein [Ferrimonas balearica]|uniref:hypothetical protein n=1 Tax=Ferrimonas balearica TaxID=44012 RepID=UPI001C99E967|nr:hypothetical protein [Ferrimonas balearica]MBY5992247.1 hypothetical protein [Ferrimonas balearica]